MQNSDQPTRNTFEKLTGFLPLMWLSLSFLVGILVDSQIRLNRSYWLALAHSLLPAQIPLNRSLWLLLAGAFVLVALVIFIVRIFYSRLPFKPFHIPSSSLLLAILSITAFLLGAARYHFTIPFVDAHYISWYNDREYELLVTGTLASPPDERDTYTNLRMEVNAVNTGDETLAVHGLILARVAPNGDWHYGEVVRLRGHLKTPPNGEDFSYQDYLAHQGIRAYMPDAEATRLPFVGGNAFLRSVYDFKDHAIAHIYQIFPDPEASLLAGILLGDDNGLPASLQQAYKNTGTAHIIAISGFNIAIIAGLFVALFSRLLGRRKGAIAGRARHPALYAAGGRHRFGGARRHHGRAGDLRPPGGPPPERAEHPVLHRRGDGRHQPAGTLGCRFPAFLCCHPRPDPLRPALWRIGRSELISRFASPEKAKKVAGPISAYLLFTLAAQLTTLPIMAYHFGRISLISLIANPFILPAQPAVMVLGGLALLLSFIYLPLGKLAGWIAWPFAAYTNRAVEFFNGFPHGVIVLGEFSLLFVVLFYALLLSLTFARPRSQGVLRAALAPSVIIAALGISAYLVWSAAFAAPDGQLHLTFLDVGSADAILIQTPSGRTVLVNGGESPSALARRPRAAAFAVRPPSRLAGGGLAAGKPGGRPAVHPGSFPG